MKYLTDILLQSSQYFALTAGIMGIMVFLIMIFSLDILKFLGEHFNATYSMRRVEKILNKNMSFEQLFFEYPRITGFFIFASCLWILVFLVFQLDSSRFVSSFKFRELWLPFIYMFVMAVKAATIVSVTLSVFYSLILIMNRNTAQKINLWLSSYYDTDRFVEKLDDTVFKDTDTICFLHNRLFGFAGLVISLVLTVMAVMNLVCL